MTVHRWLTICAFGFILSLAIALYALHHDPAPPPVSFSPARTLTVSAK